jgi:hypothetical protein
MSGGYVGVYDIIGLPQGSDFDIQIDYQTPDLATLNLTGYTGKLQVRKNYDGPVLLELTSASGDIVFDSVAPNIVLRFRASVTSAMTVYEDMIYDLEIISPTGLTTRVIKGSFSLDREVTQ